MRHVAWFGLFVVILANSGCAGRKVIANGTSNPNYDPAVPGHREIGGPLFAIRVQSPESRKKSHEIFEAYLTFQVRTYLESRGFRYTENVRDANLYFDLQTFQKGRQINVPARAFLAFGRNFGGGAYVGEHTENYQDEWLQMSVYVFSHGKHPSMLFEGTARPKSPKDSLFANNAHLDSAMSKLMSATPFSHFGRAPASLPSDGPPGCWYTTGIESQIEQAGIRITGFAESSRAEEAGLQPGDLLVSIDGVSADQLTYDTEVSSGDKPVVNVSRDGTRKSVRVPVTMTCYDI